MFIVPPGDPYFLTLGGERRFAPGHVAGRASFRAIGQMFFIPAYPFWSLMIIAVDVVALWGLCVYGSRQNLAV